MYFMKEAFVENIQGGLLAYLRGHAVLRYVSIMIRAFLLSAYSVLGAVPNTVPVLLPMTPLLTLVDRHCSQPHFTGKEMGLLSKVTQPGGGRSWL